MNAFDMTLEELQNLPNFGDSKQKFHSVVIVPMPEIHDSGFACMKFVFLGQDFKILAVMGGYNDAIEINGIGGYGDSLTAIKTHVCPVIDWQIDCLPESGCLRLFTGKGIYIKDGIVTEAIELLGVINNKEN